MIPLLAKLFGGQIGQAASGIVDSLGKVADTFITTKAEKAAFNELVTKEVNRHIEVLNAGVNEIAVEVLKDVQNARSMQIEALRQGDLFSKRFLYFFAAGIVLITMSYDFCFFWVDFPESNKDILNTTAGVLNTSCLVMVISFFFGSSKSSDDKQKQIERMVNEPL